MSQPKQSSGFRGSGTTGSPAAFLAGSAPLTRRRFLSGVAVAGGLAAAPAFAPAPALGLGGATAPSERIVLGGIGVGNRGSGVLRSWMLPEQDVHFVAVCDAQKERTERVKQLVDQHYGNSDCKVYRDMREFLAVRDDIDALLITTGDRWHALASIMAMRAGKDVYSEKPSCMTIAEGQAVVETARRYRRIYQTGVQRLSEEKFTVANELLRTGRLGEVRTVRAHIAPWDAAVMKHDWLPADPLPPKDEVDWDQWLGPCPWRPYNAKYTRGGWRGYYDFHTSCIGEWGAHTFPQCQVALGLSETSAVEYGYVDNPAGDGMATRFANGVQMILHRGDQWWRGSCGVRFEGTEGWVAVADGYDKPDVSSPALLEDAERLVREYVERTGHVMGHARDFFNCIKSRRPTVANAVVMHRSMTTVHAANICMWLKRDLRYSPDKEEFLGDAEANRLRSRAMRAPWMV